MAEDAAAEKQVALGSVGWEIFALEKEIKKKPRMRDLVDSSDEEDEHEKEIEDDSDEEDKEVTDKLWVEVVKKGIKEKMVNEKGFKENVFAVNDKGFNKNTNKNGSNKNWETKNRFEKLKDNDTFEIQEKTELNFGNMMKNRMEKGLILMKPKSKHKEIETEVSCQVCNDVDFREMERTRYAKKLITSTRLLWSVGKAR